MKRRKIIGYVVSFVEQTLAQGVLARGWCVRRTIPQQHAAMINWVFRLGVLIANAAIA